MFSLLLHNFLQRKWKQLGQIVPSVCNFCCFLMKPSVLGSCRDRHVLPLHGAGGGETRLGHQEKQGSPERWGQAVGGVPGEGNANGSEKLNLCTDGKTISDTWSVFGAVKHWNCSTKGICCYQSSTHSLPNQQPEDSDQLIQWVRSGVLLLGCKKNLQPQGSLWNDLWQKWHRDCLKGLLLIFWLCLIGKRRLPGRKLFHVGWCLSLSQHQLSLPLWVSGSWLKCTSANICPFLTFFFFDLIWQNEREALS